MIAAILLDLPLPQMDGYTVPCVFRQLSIPRETSIRSAIAGGGEATCAVEETRLLLPSAS